MTTAYFTDDVFLEHDTGLGHPERPDRLRAVWRALAAAEFAALQRRDCPPASEEQVSRVHQKGYIETIFYKIPSEGRVFLDADTLLSPRTGEAALRAAGAVCAAVDGVMAGEYRNAFCAVRPPGHHAEPTRAMGFCIFNSVAVGALQAQQVHGLSRVAVVDFDVHHGNGTQAMFQRDPGLYYASLHQYPLYPGTGAADERGVGNILNLTLTPHSGTREARDAVRNHLVPALDLFRPEMLLISAGFDAHVRDPMAGLNWADDDYAWITRQLLGVAARHAGERVVSVLEGGYDLVGLAGGVTAHVRELLGN